MPKLKNLLRGVTVVQQLQLGLSERHSFNINTKSFLTERGLHQWLRMSPFGHSITIICIDIESFHVPAYNIDCLHLENSMCNILHPPIAHLLSCSYRPNRIQGKKQGRNICTCFPNYWHCYWFCCC